MFGQFSKGFYDHDFELIGDIYIKMREGRLRWYGHNMRREENYIGKRMLRMELPGRRNRGRPKRRYMDVVKEDMRVAGVTEDAVGDREKWKKRICSGDP